MKKSKQFLREFVGLVAAGLVAVLAGVVAFTDRSRKHRQTRNSEAHYLNPWVGRLNKVV